MKGPCLQVTDSRRSKQSVLGRTEGKPRTPQEQPQVVPCFGYSTYTQRPSLSSGDTSQHQIIGLKRLCHDLRHLVCATNTPRWHHGASSLGTRWAQNPPTAIDVHAQCIPEDLQQGVTAVGQVLVHEHPRETNRDNQRPLRKMDNIRKPC